MVYRGLLFSAPESKVRMPGPLHSLAFNNCNEHLVAQQVALGYLADLRWQVIPVNRRIAVKLSSFLLIRIVGDVERFASSTLHVWTIWFV